MLSFPAYFHLQNSQDVPGFSAYVKHINSILTTLDDLACTWLTAMDGVNFDVFVGFEHEQELEHYFLHNQYKDNVTVLAGRISFTPNNIELPVYLIKQNYHFYLQCIFCLYLFG